MALTGTVVRCADWARLLNASQALREAQQQSDSSAAQAAATEHAARERGFAEGLQQGRAEGLRQVLSQLHEKDRVVARLQDELVLLVEQAVRELISLAGSEVVLRQQVVRAVTLARRHQNASLRVAPQCLPQAQALLLELAGDSAPTWLQVLPDANLSDCDMVLEAEGAIFDGRLHAQVQHWRAALQQALAPGGGAPQEQGHAD